MFDNYYFQSYVVFKIVIIVITLNRIKVNDPCNNYGRLRNKLKCAYQATFNIVQLFDSFFFSKIVYTYKNCNHNSITYVRISIFIICQKLRFGENGIIINFLLLEIISYRDHFNKIFTNQSASYCKIPRNNKY